MAHKDQPIMILEIDRVWYDHHNGNGSYNYSNHTSLSKYTMCPIAQLLCSKVLRILLI